MAFRGVRPPCAGIAAAGGPRCGPVSGMARSRRSDCASSGFAASSLWRMCCPFMPKTSESVPPTRRPARSTSLRARLRNRDRPSIACRLCRPGRPQLPEPLRKDQTWRCQPHAVPDLRLAPADLLGVPRVRDHRLDARRVERRSFWRSSAAWRPDTTGGSKPPRPGQFEPREHRHRKPFALFRWISSATPPEIATQRSRPTPESVS